MLRWSGRIGFLGMLTILIQFPLDLMSQDIHFSQSENAPLMINPSLAGEYTGNCRFIMNYRSQWRSVTNNPYNTFSASADAPLYKKRFFGGVQVFRDVAGDGHFGTTQLSFSGASRVRINRTDYLKLGLQAAWTQHSIDMSLLSWNSQFDGTSINTSLSSGEPSRKESFSVIDMSAGGLYSHSFEDKSKLNIGIAGFHLTEPSHGFISEKESLNIRFCLHSDVGILLENEKTVLYPSFLFMLQGAYRELNAGAAIKHRMGLNSKYTGLMKPSYVYFGLLYRNKDAIVVSTRLNYKSLFDFAISYDINISRLNMASGSKGGAELSIIYLIPEPVLKKVK